MLDMIGYGLSAKPDAKYSLFSQADVVEACALELGLGDVALVTHDMGDSVGGEILAREIDGNLSFHVTRPRAHERLDLHGPRAAHRRPEVPPLAARRGTARRVGPQRRRLPRPACR